MSPARRTPKPALTSTLAACLLAGVALVAAGAQPAAQAAKPKKKGPALIASDTASSPDPVPFWGEIECQTQARHEWVPTGGDPHPTVTGAPQLDTAYRRLRVLDGDEFSGERCELGDNNRFAPTAFYREGRRRVTSLSLRLPTGFPVDTTEFQVVAQMKQATPAANAGGPPVLELQAFLGRWKLIQSRKPGFTTESRQLWSAPAQIGVWTRFTFNIRYSQSARKGRLRVLADLNGDNDSLDPGERSRNIHTFTLKREIVGGSRDGLRPGQSIPSHLRAGIHHDPAIPCPPPAGCQIDVDNVQVLRP